MAELETLNFKLILDDSEFNKQIDDVKKKAEELNASLSDALQVGAGNTGILSEAEIKNIKKMMELEQSRINKKMAAEEKAALQKLKHDAVEVENEQKKLRAVEKTAKERAKTAEAENKSKKSAVDLANAYKRLEVSSKQVEIAEERAAEAAKRREMATTNAATAEIRQETAMLQREAAQKRLTQMQERGANAMTKSAALMKQMATYAAGYFSANAMVSLVKNATLISAEFEKQRIALRAILQDVNGADRIFSQIRDLAVASPFAFKDLAAYAKQLSAFSIPIDELYDTTKMLADVSAGLGVSMDRIVLAYGQIRSASFLRGQEVRQLTEAGIPILEELRKQFEAMGEVGITAGEVFDKISSRQVSFKMVEKVFKDMTSEGGKFYQMQEVLAESLSGKIQNLADAFQKMYSEIGEKGGNTLIGNAIDSVRKLAENYEKLGAVIKDVVVALGMYKSIMATISAVNMLNNLTRVQSMLLASTGKHLSILEILIVKLGKLTIVQKALNAVMKINPYAAAAAALAGLVVILNRVLKSENDLAKSNRILQKTMKFFNNEVNNESAKLEYLFNKLGKVTEGTEEYNKAKEEILKNYSQYLNNIDRENLALGKQKAVYDSLVLSIREAAKEKALDEGMGRFTEMFNDSYNNAFDALESTLNNFTKKTGTSITKAVKQQIADFVRGDADLEDLSEEAKRIIENISARVSASAQGGATVGAGLFDIKSLANNVELARKLLVSNRDGLANTLEIVYGVAKKEDPLANLMGWQTKVDAILKGFKSRGIDTTVLDYTPFENAAEYVEKLRQTYSQLENQKKDTAGLDDSAVKMIDAEMEAIRELDKVLKHQILTSAKSTDTTTSQVSAIDKQIASLKELKTLYEELKNYLDEDTISRIFGDIFPQGRDLQGEIDTLIASLAQFGDKGAEVIAKYVTKEDNANIKDYIKNLENLQKAEEDYRDFMESWDPIATEGEGTSANVSKIVNNYLKTVNDIKKKKDDALKKLDEKYSLKQSLGLFTQEDVDKVAEEQGEINAKAVTDISNAMSEAREKLAKEGEKYVESLEVLQKFDLSDWSHMTINQLKDLKDELENINVDDLPDEVKEMLSSVGGGLDSFKDAMSALIDSFLAKEKNQEIEKNLKQFKNMAKTISNLGEAIAQFGEAAGNVNLESIGKQLSSLANATGDILEGYSKGGTTGAIVSAVSAYATALMNAALYATKLKTALKEARLEGEALSVSSALSKDVDSIFGTDTYKSFENAYNVVSKYSKLIEADKDALDQTMKYRNAIGEFFDSGVLWMGNGLAVLLEKVIGFGNKSKTLSELAESVGGELLNEYGSLNADTLQRILDTYDNLSQADREWIEKAIANTEAYSNAMKQLEDALSSLYGNVAGDVADAIIEQWRSMGNAAADYSETLDAVAESYAKMLIQNTMLENLFDDDFQKQLTELTKTKNAAGVMSLFETKLAELEDYYPYFEDILNSLSQYFVTEDNGSTSLASGIKNVTEETANLLSSYINAIRADVSFNKLTLSGIAEDIKSLLGMFPSAPSLTDYLMQIQANTYDTAENTREILSELRSVVGLGSEGSAIKVLM